MSDVFHTANGKAGVNVWEFKHGQGLFRKGDLTSLRLIKRRTSKTNSNKMAQSQPGTPAEMQPMNEAHEARISQLEYVVNDLHNRLHRSEDHANFLTARYFSLVQTTTRLSQTNQELGRTVASLAGPDHRMYRDAIAFQNEMQRHIEVLRSLEDGADSLATRHQAVPHPEYAQMTPSHQAPPDDSRRLNVPHQQNYNNAFRPRLHSNASFATRPRYGSTAANSTTQVSPLHGQAPSHPHPLAIVDPQANLARRHTAADIRARGWDQQDAGWFPYNAAPPASHWTPSPNTVSPEDTGIQESLSAYSLQAASRVSHSRPHSRPTTPSLPPFSCGPASGYAQQQPQPPYAAHSSNGIHGPLDGWGWGGASRNDRNPGVGDGSLPPTRRGSMAHILNHDGGHDLHDSRRDEDRNKRRRLS